MKGAKNSDTTCGLLCRSEKRPEFVQHDPIIHKNGRGVRRDYFGNRYSHGQFFILVCQENYMLNAKLRLG